MSLVSAAGLLPTQQAIRRLTGVYVDGGQGYRHSKFLSGGKKGGRGSSRIGVGGVFAVRGIRCGHDVVRGEEERGVKVFRKALRC